MKKAKVLFAGREVDFVDRDLAIRWVEDLAERGTALPMVIYGPEGCGKTAFFKQATEVLKEHGYSVVHVNPLTEAVDEKLVMTTELKPLLKDALNVVPNPFGDAMRLADLAIELLYLVVKREITRRIALLVDDVFQAVGLDKAEQLIKGLLNMVEHPSVDYEKIIVMVGSSEGITRERVGRHNWAGLRAMWNMGRDGFRQLYEALPGGKPPFNEVWGLTGGNPRMLEQLYLNGWNVNGVVEGMIKDKGITPSFITKWRTHLEEAIKDPDYLWWGATKNEEVEALRKALVEKNLVIGPLYSRDSGLWIDEPPSTNAELGIGEYYAWQTPLHREAVRRVLGVR